MTDQTELIIERILLIKDLLMRHLVEKGYPVDSLSESENDTNDFDLSIVEPETRELLAVIKIETPNYIISTSDESEKDIKNHSRLQKKSDIKFFTVGMRSGNLEFSQLTSGTKNIDDRLFVPINGMPLFNDLKQAVLGLKRDTVESRITIVCGISAFFLLILFILNLSGVLELTFERLSLISLIIALILIPSANKLRIFNIEFERRNEMTLK